MGRAYEVRKASIQKTGAQKAKLYSNFSKEIYQAAKSGIPDPDSNIALKRIMEKAKRSQVPSDIINRAVEKAKSSGGEDYKEVIYEGFGPNNSTLMIKCLTDNVNRTVANVREAFNKTKNKIGVSNSVSYNYDHLAIIGIKSNDEEKIMDMLLNEGIEIKDIESEEGIVIITSSFHDASAIKDCLEKNISNVSYEIDEVGLYPKEKIKLSGESLDNFTKLLDMLDNIDDVTDVYHNVEL